MTLKQITTEAIESKLLELLRVQDFSQLPKLDEESRGDYQFILEEFTIDFNVNHIEAGGGVVEYIDTDILGVWDGEGAEYKEFKRTPDLYPLEWLFHNYIYRSSYEYAVNELAKDKEVQLAKNN